MLKLSETEHAVQQIDECGAMIGISRQWYDEAKETLAAYEAFNLTLAELAEKLEKLAAWEAAEQDGRLVVLPCKSGDIIYRIYTDGHGNPDSQEIDALEVYYVYVKNGEVGISYDPYDGHLGPVGVGSCWNIYLTREEAEKALEATP